MPNQSLDQTPVRVRDVARSPPPETHDSALALCANVTEIPLLNLNIPILGVTPPLSGSVQLDFLGRLRRKNS
jgi:hypothetical protein